MATAQQVTSPSESSAAGIVETEDLTGMDGEAMAGRPHLQEMLRKVEASGGEDAVLDRMASGETIKTIAESFGVSRQALSGWLNRTLESKNRAIRARESAAHALVEEALDLADTATHQNDRAIREKIRTRQWTAGKWNRETYGESPLVALQFNVGDLALEALKQAPPPVPAHLIVEADDTQRSLDPSPDSSK